MTSWSIRTAARDTSPEARFQLAPTSSISGRCSQVRAAPGTGNRDTYPHRIISTPFLGEPGSISSETYLCIGPFDSKNQAESVLSYLTCRLTRLLILLHKPSQDTTRKVYSFVPTQKWTKRWTDEDLYAKYGISASEIAFIEKVVRPMERRAMSKDFFPPRPASRPNHLRLRGHKPAVCRPAEGRLHHRGCAEPRCPAVSDVKSRQAALPNRSRRTCHAERRDGIH